MTFEQWIAVFQGLTVVFAAIFVAIQRKNSLTPASVQAIGTHAGNAVAEQVKAPLQENSDLLRQALQNQTNSDTFYRNLVDRLDSKVERLEARLADRERQSAENTRQINELTTTSQESQRNLQEKINALQKDSNNMQQDLIKAKEELARTKAEHEQTKADLIKAQERIKALEDERDKERAASAVKIEQLTKELETERGKVQDLQTQLDNQANRIKFLEGQVATLSKPSEPPKSAETTTP